MVHAMNIGRAPDKPRFARRRSGAPVVATKVTGTPHLRCIAVALHRARGTL